MKEAKPKYSADMDNASELLRQIVDDLRGKLNTQEASGDVYKGLCWFGHVVSVNKRMAELYLWREPVE